ncbi:MAG: ATP-binding protein [Bacteroides sp.]|nr:ATP-binding protein [Bacteroides sp.]
MLYRKIEAHIREYLESDDMKVLIVEGARQIGKSFIIRKVASELYPNFIEINLLEDNDGLKLFEKVKTTEDFYLQLGMLGGDRLGDSRNTLVFLDEIQEYPHLLTMLKFLRQEGRFRYVASGSLLGLTLHKSTSIPIGSIHIMHMYPLDFEEFLIANKVGEEAITHIYESFRNKVSLEEGMHGRIIDLFRKYLLAGGMPEAVNRYIDTHNIIEVRTVQADIYHLYKEDAAKYDKKNKLKIERIYQMIPSLMENKKKRVVVKDIDNKPGSRYATYQEEFEYLIDSGIALEVKAVSGPRFPLIESGTKNLLKLYLNDVGLLTGILYRNNIRAVLDTERSVNLGAVYESVVAQELTAHGYNPFYYDNKKNGEVEYLIDDYASLSVLPIEVKSGKDYTVHSALDRFVTNPDYNVKEAFVFSNAREVKRIGKILHLPIYYVMCLDADYVDKSDLMF